MRFVGISEKKIQRLHCSGQGAKYVLLPLVPPHHTRRRWHLKPSTSIIPPVIRLCSLFCWKRTNNVWETTKPKSYFWDLICCNCLLCGNLSLWLGGFSLTNRTNWRRSLNPTSEINSFQLSGSLPRNSAWILSTYPRCPTNALSFFACSKSLDNLKGTLDPKNGISIRKPLAVQEIPTFSTWQMCNQNQIIFSLNFPSCHFSKFHTKSKTPHPTSHLPQSCLQLVFVCQFKASIDLCLPQMGCLANSAASRFIPTESKWIKRSSAPGLFEDPEAVELSHPAGSRRLSLQFIIDIRFYWISWISKSRLSKLDRLLEMSLNRRSNTQDTHLIVIESR